MPVSSMTTAGVPMEPQIGMNRMSAPELPRWVALPACFERRFFRLGPHDFASFDAQAAGSHRVDANCGANLLRIHGTGHMQLFSTTAISSFSGWEEGSRQNLVGVGEVRSQ